MCNHTAETFFQTWRSERIWIHRLDKLLQHDAHVLMGSSMAQVWLKYSPRYAHDARSNLVSQMQPRMWSFFVLRWRVGLWRSQAFHTAYYQDHANCYRLSISFARLDFKMHLAKEEIRQEIHAQGATGTQFSSIIERRFESFILWVHGP